MKYRGNRGSEWRKWDLHVHTPESGMSNKFGNNWDEYVKALFQTAILNEVAVIGITDYFTIDGYKKLKREYCENVPKLLELFDNDAELVDKIRQIKLFPNIEFRLNTFVGSSRINYHVIFSDQLSIEDIEDSFLHELKFSYEQYPDATDCRHSLKRSNIENLGKKLKSEQPSFRDSDFVVGCTNAVVNDNQIRETLKNYSDKFEGKYIIVVPVDEDLSSLSWNGQDHHVRKGFYQHANAFFTSNIKTIEFALGKYDKDNYLNEFKSFKPCFIGCDAHSCEEIKQKLGQHYTKYNDSNPKKVDYEVKTTWIKADTTFEGLLQTLFEPESRVRIQSSRPETKPERSVISSVMFQSSEELFGNQVIHLNECLNSIIGGKSSGKSLLLHSMACAIDKDQVERISKTLNIGEYNSVFDYDLIVTWQDGITNSLSNNYTEEVKREITYIPQLYINYLAEKENREELNKLLLNILLQNSSFKIFYWSKRKEIEQVTSAIEVAYSKMISSRDKALLHQNELKRIGKSQEIMKSIEKLNAQIDAITRMSTLSFKEQDEYKRLIDQEKALYAEKQIIQNNIETKRDIAVEINDTINRLCGTDTSRGTIDSLLMYHLNVPEELLLIKDEFCAGITTLKDGLNQRLHLLGYEVKLSEVDKKIVQIKKAIEPYTNKLAKEKEIQVIRERVKQENEKLQLSQQAKSNFDTALGEYRSLQGVIANLLNDRYLLYKEIEAQINTAYSAIGEDINLELSIKQSKESFVFYEQVNKNKVSDKHPFNELFVNDGNEVDYSQIPVLFANIVGVNANGELSIKNSEEKYILNHNYTLLDVYEGLIADNLKLCFDVRYKNDTLMQMSPGKKGTVLLILFLYISSAECPILIDQPEDNLDNRTIYELLCKMIKEKKVQRQIILVSHNANIVVATDSENVIVANQEGQTSTPGKNKHRFEYVNGPLEFSFEDSSQQSVLQQRGIKQHVCDILEGGDEAFRHREQKYAMKWISPI